MINKEIAARLPARPDHARLSDVEPKLICSACGKKGAELRPLFPEARMGTS